VENFDSESSSHDDDMSSVLIWKLSYPIDDSSSLGEVKHGGTSNGMAADTLFRETGDETEDEMLVARIFGGGGR
jgi:hypothetical protein